MKYRIPQEFLDRVEAERNGGPLTAADLANLARSYITPELVEAAGLRRYTSSAAATLLSANPQRDCGGIAFPYRLPGESAIRLQRVRRDNPETERGLDGNVKTVAKYLCPAGSQNLLYFPPGVHPDLLLDVSVPVVIVEGEKKTLAATHYAASEGRLRLLPVGLSGVWNFRGRRTPEDKETSPIPDLDRIVWNGRKVYIVFDSNAETDEGVGSARRKLTEELSGRGALVHWVRLPEGDLNGIDDILGAKGRDFVDDLFQAADNEGPITTAYSGTPTTWPEIVPLFRTDLPSLDVRHFPTWLGDHIAAAAAATETPVELAAMLDLAVVATAVAGKFVITPEPGYEEPLNVYLISAMESGNRKTGVQKAATAPLYSWERDETERLRPEIERARTRRRTIEAQIDSLRRRAGRKTGDVTDQVEELIDRIAHLEAKLEDVPAYPKLWTDDITPERVGVLLQEQGGKLAILSDEGGIFEIMGGRYSGAPNLEVFLKGHAGSPIRVDRGNRPQVHVPAPALTMGLCPQPEVLRAIAGKPGFRGKGLLARFLYTLPESTLGYRKLRAQPAPQIVNDAYAAGIHGLLRLPTPEASPHPLGFTVEAYAVWKDFQRLTEDLMRSGAALDSLKDWGSKLAGQTARIAALLHVVQHAHGRPQEALISGGTTQNAVSIAKVLIEHARAVFVMMAADPAVLDAEKVLSWIARNALTEFTVRDCFCAHQGRFGQVDGLRPALKILADHGYIHKCVEQSQNRGRRRELYKVNPAVDLRVSAAA